MNKLSEVKKEAFFAAVAACGNAYRASRLSGINQETGYKLRNEFPDKFKEAEEAYVDSIREKFTDFALEGVWEEMAFQGGVTGKRRKISPQLLVKLVESVVPEFKPRQQIELSGNVSTLTDDELRLELARLEDEVNE